MAAPLRQRRPGQAETSWTQIAGVEGTVIYGLEGVIALGVPGADAPLRVYRRTSGVSFASKGEWKSISLPPDPPPMAHQELVRCILEDDTPRGTRGTPATSPRSCSPPTSRTEPVVVSSCGPRSEGCIRPGMPLYHFSEAVQ